MMFHVHKRGENWLVVETSKEGTFVRGEFSQQRDAVMAVEHFKRTQAAVAAVREEEPAVPLSERGFGV